VTTQVDQGTGAAATTAPNRVTVYWIPGCGNCTRLKGYLTDRGVDYVAIDVQADPDVFDEMERAGMRSFPSVRVAERWSTGIDLDKVDQLLGLTKDPAGRILPADELAERAAALLEAAARYAMQIPAEHHDDPTPTMDGFKKAISYMRDGTPRIPHHSYKSLVHHIVGHGVKFLRFALASDGVHEVGFSFAGYVGDDLAFGEPEPGTPMYRVVDQMRLTARDIRAWVTVGGPSDLSITAPTSYGPQTHHQLMQTMVCGLAQHDRQLMEVLAQRLGIAPDGPVDDELFDGLLLPTSVWGE